MGDGFIVRRGGGGAEVERTASPTINEVDVGYVSFEVTIKNNDIEEASIYYGLSSPLMETVIIEGNGTSDGIIFDNLDQDTEYTVFAYAIVNDSTLKQIKSEIVSITITTDVFVIDEGLIVMWFGQSNEVPSGFALCDGTNGTPDLRNRFIIGAGDEYSIEDTGGSVDIPLITHTHTANTNTGGTNHSHTMRFGGAGNSSGIMGIVNGGFVGPGGTYAAGGHVHSHNLTISSFGGSGYSANIPPYRSLFYIIKVSGGI